MFCFSSYRCTTRESCFNANARDYKQPCGCDYKFLTGGFVFLCYDDVQIHRLVFHVMLLYRCTVVQSHVMRKYIILQNHEKMFTESSMLWYR